jgi:hypothetical protein
VAVQVDHVPPTIGERPAGERPAGTPHMRERRRRRPFDCAHTFRALVARI